MSQFEPVCTKSIQAEPYSPSKRHVTRAARSPRSLNRSAGMDRARPKIVHTTVMGENDFYKQGLIATLATTRFKVIQELMLLQSTSHSILKSDLFIIIASLDFCSKVPFLLAELAKNYPEACVAVISDEDLQDNALASSAFGFLPKDISPVALLLALELILCKEVGIGHPHSAKLAPQTIGAVENSTSSAPHRLSSREQQVIDLVARGQSNKSIAKHLSIEENTVKAHVRTVLRKTGAANRTQAAMKAHLFQMGSVS